jgi:hypothetical protein
MNGIEFEKFYKKFDLRLDFFDTYESRLLYRDKFVCSYFKNPNTGERFIKFPGKWWAVSNYDKACECFETFCRKKVKEIDEFYRLRRIKEDFE